VIPGDLKKLVGGYATGTLTPEERQALFQAALEDQGLFDALAREEALRDALSDRAARARLLAALDGQPAPWWRRAWLSMPVRALAAAAALSICVLAGYRAWHSPSQPAVREVATLRPAAAPAAPPAAAENRAMSAAAAKEPRARDGRLAAGADAVRRNAARSRAAQPAAPTAHAGAQSSSGAMGSLVPGTEAPAATPVKAKDAAESGPPQAATQAQAQAQPGSVEAPQADNAVVVNRPEVSTERSGAAGSNFRPARASIMALGASVGAPLRWTVLRRKDGGSFEPGSFIPIELADLRAGDTIELRLESALDGEVSLSEGGPGGADSPVLLAATHIVSGQALITPPIAPANQGERVITLRLTRAQGSPILTVVSLNYR
jgi:hypothetical protein